MQLTIELTDTALDVLDMLCKHKRAGRKVVAESLLCTAMAAVLKENMRGPGGKRLESTVEQLTEEMLQRE
jgi:hypothetical protein